MRSRGIAAIIASLVLALGGPGVALADTGQQDGGPRFGPFTLSSGDTWDGDLLVLGGTLTVEEDALVDGDAIVVGGGAEVAGTIDGDLVVIGGRADLGRSAVVDSDLVLVGGSLVRSPGAEIGGRIENPLEDLDFQGVVLDKFEVGRFAVGGVPFGFFSQGDPGGAVVAAILSLARTTMMLITMIAIGLVLVALLPDHVGRISDSLRESPLPALGAGLATLFGSGLLILLLALTICGIPLAILGGLALAVAGVLGWISLGYLVGQRLLEEGGAKDRGPLVAVAGGVLLITLITAAPFGLGSLFSLVAGSWGLGAVALTRLGTRTYPEEAS